MKIINYALIATGFLGCLGMKAGAQAQPTTLPENPAAQPQININGTGIVTLDGASKNTFGTKGFATNSAINLSDSALAASFSERLYREGIGSITFGAQSYDFTNSGIQTGLFVNQAFLDFQTKKFETYIGRTDAPTAMIVQIPTLRGDDLVDFTMLPNPFSDGTNLEESRYSNVGAIVFNQGLTYFENLHVQHLIDSVNSGTGTGLNSYGGIFQFETVPTLEPIATIVNYGIGYEHRSIPNSLGGSSDAIYGGGTINVKRGVTNRLDLRVFDAYTTNNNTNSIGTVNDTYRANANAIAVTLRYLNSPFGKPSYSVALTAGYKDFRNISGANESTLVLTAAKRLGEGFDAVAQVEYFHRAGALASLYGQSSSAIFQIGLSFSFGDVINENVGPRRTPMNILEHYLPK